MGRLLLCGWDAMDAGLVGPLRYHTGLQPVAVGDTRAAALVDARTTLGVPCYQHLHEMVRTTPCDAALLGTPGLAAALASDLAAQGADLLLHGDRMDGAAMEAAATAVVRYGVSLAILRPLIHTAAIELLTDSLQADPRWTPRSLQIEAGDRRPASSRLRDAVALAARLMHATPAEVIASATGEARGYRGGDPAVLAAHIRFEDGALATLVSRPSEHAFLRVSAHTDAGTAELHAADGESRLTLAAWGATPQRSLLRDGDPDDLAACHAAEVLGGDARDAMHAHREASLLLAIEAATDSGLPVRVEDLGTRSTLRVLAGSAMHATPRAGRLHVV